jgi:hypothetical protein
MDQQPDQWESIREREARWQRAVELAVAAGLERDVAERAVTKAAEELGPLAFRASNAQPAGKRDA